MKHMKSILVICLAALLLTGCVRFVKSRPDESSRLALQEDQTVRTSDTTDPGTEETTEYTEETAADMQTEPTTEPVTEPVTEPATEPPTEPVAEPQEDPATQSSIGMKAMWLSQYDLTGIYLSNGVQRDREDFTAIMNRVMDDLVELGFNTVFLQVRPNGDSMYPSDYYPMSKYVVGSYGSSASYDPVQIIISLARERGLYIHAWINPLRCMTDNELQKVPAEYPIRKWYDDPACRGKLIVQSGSTWYLNPAYPEVRNLIVAGASELLTRYDFDGLHMDDYFYPTTDASFDAEAYRDYTENGGNMTLAEFRRNSLNQLVSELYRATKASGNQRLFGISPAGNIKTVYENQYADVYTWCAASGYIDYICPQVYFGLEHQNFGFAKVCNTWQSIIKTDCVDLMVGMTFGKAQSGVDNYAGTGKTEWQDHKDVLKRSLEYTAQLEKCVGIAVFCYQYYCDPVTGTPVAETAQEWENFVLVLKSIAWD